MHLPRQRIYIFLTKYISNGTGLNLRNRGALKPHGPQKAKPFLPESKKAFTFIIQPTLSQMWPEQLGWAAIYVQDFDAPCVMQFAWISALCCALHRSTSQVIHRSGSFFKFVLYEYTGENNLVFPSPKRREKYIYRHANTCTVFQW
jgi:hypothetical protein